MNFFLSFGFLLMVCVAHAQNVGVNQPTPVQPLHVTGTTRLDSALVLHPATTLAPADAIALPSRVATLTIGADASTTLNVLTPPSAPIEGQVLYIANTDDDPATFAGTSIAANNGFNQYLYLGGLWRLISKQPASGSGWGLEGNDTTTPGVGVGENYCGTSDAQDFILATNALARARFESDGDIRLIGNLLNQSIGGSYSTTAVALPGVIASTSVTVEDGPGGTNNSGAIILGQFRISNISCVSGSAGDYQSVTLTLQRDTDPAFPAPTTLMSIPGTVTGRANNTGTGCIPFFPNIPIIFYDDLSAASAGTVYYYRVSGSTNNVCLGACSMGVASCNRTSLNVIRIKQ